MLDKTSDIAIAVEAWLAAFEAALTSHDDGALRKLFHPDSAMSYYRSALALRRATNYRSGEATTLNDLGLLFHAQGELDSALAYYSEALGIERRLWISRLSAGASFGTWVATASLIVAPSI